jgi:hypothetical protein
MRTVEEVEKELDEIKKRLGEDGTVLVRQNGKKLSIVESIKYSVDRWRGKEGHCVVSSVLYLDVVEDKNADL